MLARIVIAIALLFTATALYALYRMSRGRVRLFRRRFRALSPSASAVAVEAAVGQARLRAVFHGARIRGRGRVAMKLLAADGRRRHFRGQVVESHR